MCYGPGSREGCLKLAHYSAAGGIWSHPPQRCLQRCHCSQIWLATSTYPLHVCLWHQFLYGACPFVPNGCGFPIVRHNEVRDLTAKLMSEVYHDVCIEPTLQPITGEALSGASAITEDGARLDVAANGFWGGRFDVKVFNPHAPSNRQPLSSCHRKHENIKKLAYEQRVREVEHGSFTHLVMSLTVGLGSATTTCYKRFASLCSLPNGNSPTAVLWPGSVAACHSLFFSRQSGA